MASFKGAVPVRHNSAIGAGILFTNGKLVLAGYHSKTRIISGIGGKALTGETARQTAAREMLEEVLDLAVVPQAAITFAEMYLEDKPFRESKGYIFYICSFDDLNHILWLIADIIKRKPLTITDLLFTSRRQEAEISQFCLLPVAHPLTIDTEFLDDIKHMLPSDTDIPTL